MGVRYFIYQITNLKNGKFYIGQHRCECEFLDSNYWGSGTTIKRAVKYHGKENFKREVLVECTSKAALNFMEKVYVGQELVENKMCYNLKTGGDAGSHGTEARRKISEANKGNTSWNKGRTVPEETRRKTSESLKGRTHSEERRKAISKGAKGKTRSEEARRNMSEAAKGRPRSAETRRKISEARKAYWANKRGDL